MARDWQESRDAADASTASPPEAGPGAEGIRAIQGEPEAAEVNSAEDWPTDRTFSDRQGRDITLRTYSYGDQHDIRAYDRQKMDPPETNNLGQAGNANLRIERDGDAPRARLQDITVPPDYQGNGIGGELLTQAEMTARQNSAQEICGLAPDDHQTRGWYEHRGYQFRASGQGQEVFKKL